MQDDLIRHVGEQLRKQGRKQGIDRRGFLKLSALSGSGLLLASAVPVTSAEEDTEKLVFSAELNAFVSVDTDGKIRIYFSNAEMGQGIKTALPMIIAEEMGARWEDVEVLQAPVDEAAFGRQGAGGSTTIPRTWNPMRQMGATARELFISAGALVMEVPREELTAEDSRVTHTSGNYRTFAQLATLAAKQEPIELDLIEFRAREDYRIIGKAVTGVDNLAITTGMALFGIDTRVPDMLYAAYQKCPAVGGEVVSANVEAIRKMPGIVDAFVVKGNGSVYQLLDGVAIVGKTTWDVFRAKSALEVEWNESAASKDSWTQKVAFGATAPGKRGDDVTLEKGDVDAVFADAGNTVHEAFYEYPYVSHFCLEPMNCTAHYVHGSAAGKDTVEVWLPNQSVQRPLASLKSMFGLEEDQVTIHQMRLGGSFGRRIFTEYLCEAVEISKRVRAPVKLTWTREDCVRHDFYRVGGFQAVKAAVDGNGKLVAYENHHVGVKSDGRVAIGSGFTANEFPLENIDNGLVTNSWIDIGTPAGPWRAPRSNVNAFVTQGFLFEVAQDSGRDYVEFLLEILGKPRWFDPGNIRSLNTGRAADVIKLAAEKGGWGRDMPEGTGLGFSFYFCHAAHVAEVAEVSVSPDKKLDVKRVTVVADVGPIINRSGALSQVEGSIIDGLSTMMGQKITMEAGRIEQSNFHDYPVLRIPAAPVVDTHFIESDNDPTGLGEPALPPLAPAVANAIYMATGHRVRKMPLSEEGFTI